jgi:hypothetical protein
MLKGIIVTPLSIPIVTVIDHRTLKRNNCCVSMAVPNRIGWLGSAMGEGGSFNEP